MIIDNIAKYIKDNGIKQRMIAEKTGIGECALSAILTRKRKLSADEYEKICVVLKKDPNFFMKKIED